MNHILKKQSELLAGLSGEYSEIDKLDSAINSIPKVCSDCPLLPEMAKVAVSSAMEYASLDKLIKSALEATERADEDDNERQDKLARFAHSLSQLVSQSGLPLNAIVGMSIMPTQEDIMKTAKQLGEQLEIADECVQFNTDYIIGVYSTCSGTKTLKAKIGDNIVFVKICTSLQAIEGSNKNNSAMPSYQRIEPAD